jgi:serpin B
MLETPTRRFRSDSDIREFGSTHFRLERLEQRLHCDASPVVTPEQIISQANNAFAFDLLPELSKKSGNVFFSPYSADTAMEMALQGANGATADQIIQALHLPSSEIAQAGIEALYQLFQAAPATAGYTLSTANRLWINQNFGVLESFIDSEQNIFGASPQAVDFSNPNAAANTINNWVSAQTDGKIADLIPPGDLSKFTGLVLTNAIYFQGTWVDSFNPTDTTESFQVSSTDTTMVQMMTQTNDLGFYSQSGPNGFQALELPYEGNNLDMLVILPTATDLGQMEASLNPALFSKITSGLSVADVQVSLPKFQLNETYDLVPALKDLGIKAAFNPITADFTGISETPSYISAAIQKSFITVDETGTTAAAATGIVMMPTAVVLAPNAVFDADHPFIFAIRDNATNTILFLGSVTNPSGDAPPPTQMPRSDADRVTDPVPVSTTPPAISPAPVTNPTPVELPAPLPPPPELLSVTTLGSNGSLSATTKPLSTANFTSADAELLDNGVSPTLAASDLLLF